MKSSAPFSLAWSDNGVGTLRAQPGPGLQTLMVDADGSRFDWEELYVTLNVFGNVNQRTGPWDFNLLENNRPVLPAYWMWRNGRKIGLWYFNRPSAEEMDARRFRGELTLWIADSKPLELRFEPYQPFQIHWDRVELQTEPHDRLEEPPPIPSGLVASLLPDAPPQSRFTDGFWNSVEWCKPRIDTGRNSGFQMPILAAAWKWSKDQAALDALRQVITTFLDQPVWGNPREDGYGHNGDMAAACPLFGITFALCWVPDELADLRSRLLKKVVDQGNIFLEMALLQRGYWGGSIMQDHGFVSFGWFACAAFALYDYEPEVARRWLRFALPRMRRTLDALPLDGVAPITSYATLWMYVDKLVVLRELLLKVGEPDIYREPALARIASATRALTLPDGSGTFFPSPRGDVALFDGAHAFLAQQAADPEARWLLDRTLDTANIERSRPIYNDWHFQKDWLWALLFADPAAEKPTSPLAPLPAATWFEDSGLVALRQGETIAVGICGPPVSHNAYRQVTSPCDRIIGAPLSGHFAYYHRGRLALQTAEGGYRMTSLLGNVLVVDGKGQKGDRCMPMGHPNARWHGEKIIGLTRSGDGFTCDLAPAYDGLDSYRRALSLLPGGTLRLEDEIEAPAGHDLEWRFQSFARNKWKEAGPGRWTLTVEQLDFDLQFQMEGAEFTSAVDTTLTVWGYVNSNNNEPCRHLAVHAVASGQPIRLRFEIRPSPGPTA